MRNLLLSTTAAIALSALLGFAGAAQAQSTATPEQKPAQEQVSPLAMPEHQRQAEEAINSTPGRAAGQSHLKVHHRQRTPSP